LLQLQKHLKTDGRGLVMIEAMACGTPVIAYRSGSVPEVVEDGVTGFIVENEEQAVRAVSDLGRLDRRKVRAWLRGALLSPWILSFMRGCSSA
jgi:glycosyltransferase involved in cell wall biosynthesis